MTDLTTPIPANTKLAVIQLGNGDLIIPGAIFDSAGAEILGVLGANPDANSIAGRLKALAALLPASLGGKPAAGSLSVVPTSDGFSVADTMSAPFGSAVAYVVDTAQAAGRTVLATITAAGNVSLTLKDGSTIVIPVQPGANFLPFAASKINSAGTTATGTYANLN